MSLINYLRILEEKRIDLSVNIKRKFFCTLHTHRLESKLYTEQHTKKVLEEEKKKIVAELNDLKGQNAISDRTIRQAKTFTSKKDEAHKKMKEQQDDLSYNLKTLNENIANKAWKLDKDQRAFKDRNLLKRHNAELMSARQEFNLVNIDINIADSRIKDLMG